ncbi:DUF5685 family protein [Adlercreutzia sp. ZJ304]|uniref:DUF5685 family protein n=1 Tax=Adlercreutzia sp. ZJ304 TaxID=2709791 RepID=UPI0013ED3FED|nr:DUF5685 family protein [Adlercreutzia sp. ZJ304]
MFGIAVARLDQVSDEEKERYQAFYCGLCRTLKRRYGQVSRAALSYDLAFLVMFLDSLTEPAQNCGAAHCISHPKKRMPYCESIYSDYAADLSVALAYHKCLDDVSDDGTARARTIEHMMRGHYAKAVKRIPEECSAIEGAMRKINQLEADADASPDACAREFGQLMGQLFAAGCVWGRSLSPDSAWEGTMWARAAGEFGALLGRFIYLMDAAVDYAEDKKTGSYNPFVRLDANPGQMREILTVLAGDATSAFERLPLVQDVHLMRSVLYAGVWQKFNHTYKEMSEAKTMEGVPSE